MSVFGSRKEDPLLQDDPFAPSSEESPSEPHESSADEPPPTGAPTEGPSSSAPDAETSNSAGVFASTDAGARTPDVEGLFEIDGGDARVIACPAAETAAGRLGRLDAALGEGWRLDRIELVEGSRSVEDALGSPEPPEAKASPADPDIRLAFVLRPPDPA